MNRLVLPAAEMRHILHSLLGNPDKHVYRSLGVSRHAEGTDYLVVSQSNAFEASGNRLACRLTADSLPLNPTPPIRNAVEGSETTIHLALGHGDRLGHAFAEISHADGFRRSLDAIQIMGAGMPYFPLDPYRFFLSHDLATFAPEDGLYSRLQGAIGLETWTRLQKSRVAIIGVGGMGSQFASHLARLQGHNAKLALIDPDTLQPANLIAWSDASEEAAGENADDPRPKVDLLARHLRKMPDAPTIEAAALDVASWQALGVLKRYDLWVCCVDNPHTRRAIGYLASLYHRPLLDLSSGVFLGSGPQEHHERLQMDAVARMQQRTTPVSLPAALLASGPRTLGADVRMILPGERPGCLLCAGGVGESEDRVGIPPLESSSSSQSSPFWVQRAGSLSYLNGLAIHTGLSMLVSLFSGEVSKTTALQIDLIAGIPYVRQVSPTPLHGCPLCLRSGAGDSALADWEHVIGKQK